MLSDFASAPMHDRFVEFTRDRMASPDVARRFGELKAKVEDHLATQGSEPMKVLDVGCSMGIQAAVWAKDGYRVTGVDLDPDLIRLASENATRTGMPIDFRVGSAEDLPFDDGSFDVCMTIELIEHVESWECCLDEVTRVVKPGGMLVLTTSNVLCPVQHEYRLPLYSWWPAPMKRRAFQLASTKYPVLANYSPCPARHWFTVFQLEHELQARGMRTYDRLDMMDLSDKPAIFKRLIETARNHTAARWLLYLVLTGTIVFAVKLPSA